MYIFPEDHFDCRVTLGGTAMSTPFKLFPTDKLTRGAISKVTSVGDLTRVMTDWGLSTNKTIITPTNFKR